MRRERAIALTLAVVTLLLYGRTLFHDFVSYDDAEYVTANPVVQRGLTFEGVTWAFTTRATGNWHPVTWLSHMLDCQLYGLWPTGHHLTNLLLHLANTLLLFQLLRRLTGEDWPSAVVAGLFAWHPLHVESVAWIAERKDVLSTLFWLLALAAYVDFAKKPRRRAYGLALVWFAVGLMSKPMLVTLPLTLVLLDFWPLNRLRVAGEELFAKGWPLLREKLPFFALTAASCMVTLFAQREGGAVASLGNLSFGARLGNALLAYVGYLEKLFWPENLAVIYPLETEPSMVRIAVAVLVVLGLTVAALVSAKRRPWLTMGWLWFGITLVPVIGFVQVGLQSMADRYSYVPAIGVFIVVAWLGRELAAGKSWRIVAVRWAGGVALVGCIVGSWFQLAHWQNSITLFRRAVAVTRDNFIAQNNLGYALMAEGKLAEARALFESVLRLRPEFFLARHNYAVCLAEQGQLETALAQCDRLLETTPDYVAAHHLAGTYLERLGRTNEAILRFQHALQLAPNYGPARSSLAFLLANQGDDRAAVDALTAALRSQEDPELHYRLGNALLRLGRVDEAIAELKAAVRMNPAFAEARNNLASALVQRGERDAAILHLREAVRARPDFAEARLNLAALLGRASQWGEAAEQYRILVQSQPTNAQLHFELAVALLNRGLTGQAIPALRESLRLQPRSAGALNALALALATLAEPTLRNPEEAVRLAEAACELSRHTNAFYLDTLAVANAAAGKREEAIQAAEAAVKLASASGKANLAAGFQRRLDALRAGPSGGARLPNQ